MPRRFYYPHEVADLLQLSAASVYRRLEDGTIPSIRVGKLYRIPVEEFHQAFPTLPRPSAPPKILSH